MWLRALPSGPYQQFCYIAVRAYQPMMLPLSIHHKRCYFGSLWHSWTSPVVHDFKFISSLQKNAADIHTYNDDSGVAAEDAYPWLGLQGIKELGHGQNRMMKKSLLSRLCSV